MILPRERYVPKSAQHRREEVEIVGYINRRVEFFALPQLLSQKSHP
jgi:hypothetical protein